MKELKSDKKKKRGHEIEENKTTPIFYFITYIQAVFIHPVSKKTYETLMELCKA